MQIRLLGCERQSALRGNVVNVENDLDTCAQVIPRRFDETSTVQVQLMRRMKYRSPYMHETIRPQKVFQAAKYLIKTELYISENVALCDDWKLFDKDSNLDFICTEKDIATSSKEATQNINVDSDKDTNMDSFCPEQELLETSGHASEAINVDIQNMGAEETLIFREDDLSTYGIRIAPAEGNTPIPLHRDLNAELLSFPTIYAGVARKFKNKLKVSYTDISKSELRRYDRRACRPDRLLYSFKRSFNEKVYQALQVCMRKKVGGERVTAGNIRTPGYVQRLFTQDKGYPIFKNVRSSPMYWKEKTKKVLAMVRQLGKCAFFITLSAAETKWTELLVMLMKIVKNQTISEDEASSLSFNEIAALIRADPVTCMRHFDHKYRALLNLLFKKESGIFAPYKLQDHFSRLEFQMRGSPHSHGLYWIENAPVYADADNESIQRCIKFIDRFITCERCEEGDMKQLIQYQNHKHSRTCKKKRKRGNKCRFAFPKPPMVETRILTPLPDTITSDERKMAEQLFIKLQDKLNEWGRAFNEDIDYDLFLETILETTHMDYIYAIRSTIKRPTIFLKRSTNATFINAYNRQLLEAWRANIDVQFVLDTYACAKYCVGYILKSDGGVSRLLQAATKDARHQESTVRDKLKNVASILINGSEISAQEAAAFLLGIPNTLCSRQDVYINTARPEERIGILKSKSELDELDDESEDVCSKGIVEHYQQRPEELECICLAEFASMYQITKLQRNKRNAFEEIDSQGNEYEEADQSMVGEKKYDEVLEEQNSKTLKLRDSTRSLRKRQVRKIIRSRHYGKQLDPLNYYREKLMLFLPWRSEERELLSIDPIAKAQLHQNEIRNNARPFYRDFNIDDDILNQVFQDLEAANCEDDIEHSNELSDQELIQDDQYFEANDSDHSAPLPGHPRLQRFLKPRMVDEQEYLNLMRSLNDRQRRFVLNSIFNLKTDETPFYNFLSGGAGVGKSYAPTAIVQSYMRFFAKLPNPNPDQVCVLVSAPTGKAAFNVFGMTLHSTFRLPPTQYSGKIGNLEDGPLNTLRTKLNQVRLFIIDEVSMVSVKQLYDIDQRLRQIYSTNADFGGKAIVVIGHLRQLPPVAASPVFAAPRHLPLGECVGNHLWARFMLYELEEIMRQRGEYAFCKALNNMSEGCMDVDDIALIKSREVSVENYPPDEAIRLFKTNQECEDYNSEVHERLQTEGCLSTAHDQIQGNGTTLQKDGLLRYAMNLTTQQTDGLPYKTRLQVGGEYFVSTNVDVEDGLFNGSTGTMKLIEYGTQHSGEILQKIPIRTWMDFHNVLIGMNKRAAKKSYQKKKSNIHVDWVPIDREKRILRSVQYKGLEILRTQIPVVAANGMTINKSQGSSLLIVVVGVQRYEKMSTRKTIKLGKDALKKRKRKWLSRELLYVACSRSTTLKGLYIDGHFEPPSAPASDDPVSIEMHRLRASKFSFAIQFLQDYGEEFEKLYYHNVQSFGAHKEDILADQCAMASTILAFVEPWMLSPDAIEVPLYTCVHRTNCRGTVRNSEGALVLSKNAFYNSCDPTIDVDFKSCGHFLILNLRISGINAIMLYRSPGYPKSIFLNKLSHKLNTLTDKIIVFGDININLQNPEAESILQLLHDRKLTSKLPINCPSTDFGTTIDICFSNVLEVKAWLYESYYSYHKPVCMIWPKYLHKI